MHRNLAVVSALLLLCAALCPDYVLGSPAVRSGRKFESKLHRGLRMRGLDSVNVADVAPAQYFTQVVDHFDPTNTRTFQQKFYVNSSFYNAVAPRVLLLLGGEGPESAASVGSHFVLSEYAREFSAIIVCLEHRWYGESYPKDSTPADADYISSKQAIYDIQSFHPYFSALYKLPASTRWIVAGGSYSGALAAWTREKLPNLFVGALASSGPVQASFQFPQYLEVVANSAGPECAKAFAQASSLIEDSLKTQTGIDSINRMFNTCHPLTLNSDPLDLATFFGNLVDAPSGVVQYALDNNNYQPFQIQEMCEMMTNPAQGPLANFAAFTYAFNQREGISCNEVSYKSSLDEIMTPWPNAGWSWTIQTAREFGWAQYCVEQDGCPFSNYLTSDYFSRFFADVYGKALTPNYDAITNQYYLGFEIPTSNIVFPSGSVDPWSTWCVKSPVSGDSVAIPIEGTAHCADLYPERDTDLPGLKAARSTIRALLQKWYTQ
eukprot:ANDGO_07083.mRNA.1 Putative serine protease K12H4.7